MIVCSCEAVSDRVLRDAIAHGADTVKALRKTTGAGSQCGQCRCDLVRMIESARTSRLSQAA